MSSKGKIEDETAYENSLAWMVEKAILLEKPLGRLTEEERAKLKRIYDFVEQRVLEYNRGQMLLTDSGRLKLYKATGVAYQEFK